MNEWAAQQAETTCERTMRSPIPLNGRLLGDGIFGARLRSKLNSIVRNTAIALVAMSATLVIGASAQTTATPSAKEAAAKPAVAKPAAAKPAAARFREEVPRLPGLDANLYMQTSAEYRAACYQAKCIWQT